MPHHYEGCVWHDCGWPGPDGSPAVFIGPPELAVYSRAGETIGTYGDVTMKDCIVVGSGGDGVAIIDTGRNHVIDGLSSFANGGSGLSVRKAPPSNRAQRRRDRAQARRKG